MMWEISVNFDHSHKKPANFLFNNIKNNLEDFGSYIKILENQSVISVMIACEEYDKDRIKIFLSNAIIDTICTFFKEEFLISSLKLPIKDGIYFKALKKALISFDKETDAFLISKELSLDQKTISIESFYYFKLKTLREKWQELASIANDNGYFLICNENFVDLLKFLVDNLEITYETINVFQEGESFKLFDDFNKSIEVGDEDDLVTSLIGLCPKQIVFYGETCDNEKLNLLVKIFDKRIKFKPIGAAQKSLW